MYIIWNIYFTMDLQRFYLLVHFNRMIRNTVVRYHITKRFFRLQKAPPPPVYVVEILIHCILNHVKCSMTHKFVKHITGRSRTMNFCHFHVIFHSVVRTNMKWRLVSYSSHRTTIKAIYVLVIFREMPCGNEIDTKLVHDLEGFSGSCTTYDNNLIYSTEKD